MGITAHGGRTFTFKWDCCYLMGLLRAHMTLSGGGTARGHLLGRRVQSRGLKALDRAAAPLPGSLTLEAGIWGSPLPSPTPCSSGACSGSPERGVPPALLPGALSTPWCSQGRPWATTESHAGLGAEVCVLQPLGWGWGWGRAGPTAPQREAFIAPSHFSGFSLEEKNVNNVLREGQPPPVQTGPLCECFCPPS